MLKDEQFKIRYDIIKSLGYNKCVYIRQSLTIDNKEQNNSFICFYKDDYYSTKHVNNDFKTIDSIRNQSKSSNDTAYLEIHDQETYVRLMKGLPVIYKKQEYISYNDIKTVVIDENKDIQKNIYEKYIELSKQNKKIEDYLYSSEGILNEARIGINLNSTYNNEQSAFSFLLRENLNSNINKLDNVIDFLIDNNESLTINLNLLLLEFLEYSIIKNINNSTNHMDKIFSFCMGKSLKDSDLYVWLYEIFTHNEYINNEWVKKTYEDNFNFNNIDITPSINKTIHINREVDFNYIKNKFSFIKKTNFQFSLEKTLSNLSDNSKILNEVITKADDDKLILFFIINENHQYIENHIDSFLSGLITEFVKNQITQKNNLNKYLCFDSFILKTATDKLLPHENKKDRRRKL